MKLLLIILVLVILVTAIAFWRDIKTMSARRARRKALNRQQVKGNGGKVLSVVKGPSIDRHQKRQ